MGKETKRGTVPGGGGASTHRVVWKRNTKTRKGKGKQKMMSGRAGERAASRFFLDFLGLNRGFSTHKLLDLFPPAALRKNQETSKVYEPGSRVPCRVVVM